jgi:hypothetical protein
VLASLKEWGSQNCGIDYFNINNRGEFGRDRWGFVIIKINLNKKFLTI